MPIRYLIDVKRRLVITTAWDRVTTTEVKELLQEFSVDPDFNSEFDELVDTTGIKALELTVEEAKAIARLHPFSPTSRRAFVAPNPAVFGMLRLMLSYHEITKVPHNACPFYKTDDALKWLGLESWPDMSRTEKAGSG